AFTKGWLTSPPPPRNGRPSRRPLSDQRPKVESGEEGPASTRTATTTIHSLGEDLLLAFLRLPSLAVLVRAALACRAWRRVAGLPRPLPRNPPGAIPRPLLRALRPATGTWPPPSVAATSSSPPCNRDMAAAVRGGDFFLTSLQDRPPRRAAMQICGGYCLLMNWDDGLFAVLNPLMRTTPGSGRLCHGWTSQNLSGQMTLAAGF
ncbi:Os07g0518200, partial [Oryza sativa Japonica Group]